MAVGDTADTAAQNQTYQPQPAWALGCTGDTGDTCTKINVEAHAVNELLSGDLLAVDAKAYYAHHFNCPQCIAAGTGIRYDRRCAAGLALWSDYKGGKRFANARDHAWAGVNKPNPSKARRNIGALGGGFGVISGLLQADNRPRRWTR